MTTLPVPNSLWGLLIFVVALIILWIVVSIPVYFAGKVITAGKSSIGDAMSATLGGVLVYLLVFYAATFFLGALIGSPAFILSFILALIAWLAVYRASFDTGWIGALGIALIAWLILIVLDAFLTASFGITFPKFYPF